LAPKDAGLPLGTSREMAGYPPEQREKEADLLRRILQNHIVGGQRDWVLLNAGLLLYAGGRGASLAECTSLARRALEDGAAAKKLEALTQAQLAPSQHVQAELGSVV
jgi:anthranilate phosphoribosyltransferase